MVDEILIRFSVKDDGTPVIERVNKKLGETEKQSKALVPGLESARMGLQNFAGANAGLIAVLTGTVVALKALYDQARQGADLDYAAEKFDRLAESIGMTSDVLLDELKVATRGTLSDFEAMALAGDLVSLGLAKTGDEAIRLATVQAGLGMNMNQLVLTLTNQTTMRFDALGVKVDGFDEKVKELEKTGMSANNAFKEAFLQQAEKQLELVGNKADSSSGSFARLEAHLKNNGDAFKRFATDAVEPAVDALADMYDEQVKANDKMSANIDAVKEWNKLTGDTASARTMTAEIRRFADELERGAAMTEWATAMFEGMGGTLDRDVIPSINQVNYDFGKMVTLIDNMQQAEDRYTEKSVDLTKKREEAEAKLAQLRAQGWWEQSQKVQEAISDVEEIKQAEADLAREREKQTLQFISNLLAEQLARDGWTEAEFMAFAQQQEAWGLWSSDVVEKAKAAWMEADKITQSINAIPANKNININVSASGVDPQTLPGGYAYQYVNSNRIPHAGGGSFMLPIGGANESFMMPGGNTASGGEVVTITKANQESRTDALLQELINKKMVDENRLARTVISGIQAIGQ